MCHFLFNLWCDFLTLLPFRLQRWWARRQYRRLEEQARRRARRLSGR